MGQNAQKLSHGEPLDPVAPARDEVGELDASLRRASALLSEFHTELRRQMAGLSAANKELDAFSYSVSHDLRAPLRHVAGFASLLEKGHADRLDEQGRRYLHTIRNAASTMGRLIDDLLAFSRMGRAEMLVKDVDLGAVVKEVIAGLQPDAAGRTIDWVTGPLPIVPGDRN